MTTGAAADGGGGGGGGGGGSGGSVGTNVGGSADAYRQSSSASPRGVVTSGYCGSSASTPHSHSTNGSYSVANPYTGSPTLYTSRKSPTFFLSLSLQTIPCLYNIAAIFAKSKLCQNEI